ncbi:hypothetical protein OA78_1235 [Latilactobacillus curvatus]|nr:hypothetical protein OA78_1235 [Latilactobacillus curvatus]
MLLAFRSITGQLNYGFITKLGEIAIILLRICHQLLWF